MHILWWVLTSIFVLIGVIGFTGIINPDFFKRELKEGEKPFTRKSGIGMFSFAAVGIIVFGLLAAHSQTIAKAKQELTPDQKMDKDLEDIVISNVLELSDSKLSNITFKNNTDKGDYEVSGIVSGTDQTGKKVEFDFSAYTDDGNIVQWSTENTSTYKTETGTVDTSNGAVRKLK